MDPCALLPAGESRGSLRPSERVVVAGADGGEGGGGGGT